MLSDYEIKSVDKFINEIISNNSKNKLNTKKAEILEKLKLADLSDNEKLKLENELNEIITKLAKIR